MKMFTSLAAFGVLGADYRFETRLLTTGEQRGDTLQGISSAGQRRSDVASGRSRHLRRHAGAARHSPDSWAADPGRQRVRSNALRRRLELGRRTLRLRRADLGAELRLYPGGDINVVRVDVQPGARAGAPGQVSFYPANDAVTLVNRTTTGGDTALTFDRQPGSNRIVVSGTIAAQAETRSRLITVDQPARVIGALLQHALHAHGITLRGNAEEGVTPADARLLAEKLAAALPPGRHLPEGVQQRLRRGTDQSDGPQDAGQGDWAAGLQAIGQFVQSQGIAAGAYRQVDGSGLSRMNQITAQQLTTLLLAARKQPWFAAWYNALPIAGQPGLLVGGTLQSRMVKTAAAGRAHAKSGSMTGVSSLSGYVDSATGRPLAFAIISNNYLVPGAEVKALEDRLVETLAACDATVVCR